jgi:hypothetical protein
MNPLQIKVVCAKPIDSMSPKLRFQLSDSSVDLMKAFRLGGFEGVGGTWKMPPTDETTRASVNGEDYRLDRAVQSAAAAFSVALDAALV